MVFSSDPKAQPGGLGRIAAIAAFVIMIALSLADPRTFDRILGSGKASQEHWETITLPPPHGHVSGKVHDVFGDEIPHPVITIGTFKALGDGNGHFSIEGVPVGTYEVEITAAKHRSRRFTYRVQEGPNSPRIKYDTGLWPDSFALDFHAFYPNSDAARIYAQLGIANPLDSPIYIHELFVMDERGQLVHNALATIEQIQTFTIVNPNTNLALDPYPAVVLQPRSILGQIQLPAYQPVDPADPPKVFTAIVRYSIGRNAPPHERREISIAKPSALDEDYNPHAP